MDRLSTMLLEANSDSKLSSSILRTVYALILASLAILFCGIASLCSSVICYELLLLKNAFYIAIYFFSMLFLCIFFSHIYASSSKKRKHHIANNNDVLMSTISSFQHQRIVDNERQSSTLPPPRPPRHIPVGGHALPGLSALETPGNTLPYNNNSNTLPHVAGETPGNGEPVLVRQNGLLSSLRGRDRVWPVENHPDDNNLAAMQQQSANIIGSLKPSREKLFILPEISNLILKLFIIALSFPSMLYAVFRLAVAAERYSIQYHSELTSPCLIAPIEIVQFGLLIFLIPMQAFYVFKYGRVFSRRSPMFSAFALTHLLATNFATWFEMFTVETQRFHFRTYSAVFDYYPISLNSTLSTSAIHAANINSNGTSYSYCFDAETTIRRASTEAAPFLYPLFTHYLLLVSIPLLRLLFAVAAETCIDDDDNIQLRSLNGEDGSAQIGSAFDSPCDCRHSNKGIFVNLIVIVATTSLILAAHFLSPMPEPAKAPTAVTGNPARSATIRLAYYTAQIGINSIVILAIPLAWRGLYQLDRVPHRDFSPDPRRSVYQYNLARYIITLITLGFTIIYYLAIIIAHSATLAQLVIHYWHYYYPGGGKAREESQHLSLPAAASQALLGSPKSSEYVWLPSQAAAATTPTPGYYKLTTSIQDVVTKGLFTSGPPYNQVFRLVCPNVAAVEANRYSDEANKSLYVLASSPQITVPAIVASALALGRAASSMLLAVIQVIFTVLADCRSALTDKHLDSKPGRSLVMFILTASLIAWALEIAFELHTSSIGDAVATFHSLSPSIFDIGRFIWPLFSVFTIPHMVGFRLCIAVWLYDNWLNCYSPTVI